MSRITFGLLIAIAAPAAAQQHQHQQQPPRPQQQQQGKPRATVSATVKGKITFEVETVNADVTLKNGAKDKVVASADCDPGDLRLDVSGSSVELDFEEFVECNGPFVIEVPGGSNVEIETVQGRIVINGNYGDAELASVNGMIHVDVAGNVDVESVSGGIEIKRASGEVKVETVSANLSIGMGGPASKLDFETTSGNLDWTGGCGKDCRMNLESLSGRLRLAFDDKSDFELRFESHSGSFKDDLKMTILKQVKNVLGGIFVKARHKTGAGAIDAETFSGPIELKKK